MIVEFVGCIGAGKSTLAREFVAGTPYLLVNEHKISEKIKAAGIYTIKHPKKMLYLMKLITHSKIPLRSLKQVLFSLAKQHALKNENHKIFVLEENFIQAGFFLCDLENFESSFSNYLHQIPKPDLVVYLLCDLKECKKRVKARGFDDPEDVFGKDRAEELLKMMCSEKPLKVLKKHFPNLIVFNNQQDKKEGLIKLKEQLVNKLS